MVSCLFSYMFVFNLIYSFYPGRWFRLPQPTTTDEKWLVYRPVSHGSAVYPNASGRKSHGVIEAVFRTDSIVPGNGKMRQVPFARFNAKGTGIRAGNQPEINVSLRNLDGKVRIAAGCQLKNTDFRRTLIKSFSIFSVTERQTKKVFQRSQWDFSYLKVF